MRTSRRQFLKYGCLVCSTGLIFSRLAWAQAANRNVVQDFRGVLLINTTPAMIGQEIKAGDKLSTGVASKATIIFWWRCLSLKRKYHFCTSQRW